MKRWFHSKLNSAMTEQTLIKKRRKQPSETLQTAGPQFVLKVFFLRIISRSLEKWIKDKGIVQKQTHDASILSWVLPQWDVM